jgi:hypothetical protein
MSVTNQRVVASAAIISVGVGSANAVLKYHRLPSHRFIVGSGLSYLILSAMAQGEASGEIAKGLALGVMTTILLGDGGGLFSYIAGDAETDTAKKRILADSPPADPDAHRPIVRNIIPNPNGGFRSDHLPPTPGVTPTTNR